MAKEVIMHNLISFNQLAATKQSEEKIKDTKTDDVEQYFECLVECEENSHDCKTRCREVFT